MAARDIPTLAKALAARLGAGGESMTMFPRTRANGWMRHARSSGKRGAGIVIAGETQPPEVHALVQQMNASFGNVGVNHYVRSPPAIAGNQLESLRALVDEMKSGAVELLVILGGNPVYDSPVDLDFAAALAESENARASHACTRTKPRCSAIG